MLSVQPNPCVSGSFFQNQANQVFSTKAFDNIQCSMTPPMMNNTTEQVKPYVSTYNSQPTMWVVKSASNIFEILVSAVSSCDKCDYGTIEKAEYNNHIQTKHKDSISNATNIILRCQKCSMTFTKNEDLTMHAINVHSGFAMIAPKPSSPNVNGLKREENENPCDQCDNKFDSRLKLAYHKNRVHNNPNNQLNNKRQENAPSSFTYNPLTKSFSVSSTISNSSPSQNINNGMNIASASSQGNSVHMPNIRPNFQNGKPVKQPKQKQPMNENHPWKKLMRLSPELADVLGTEAAARSQVLKELWAYLKKHNLQDPVNKQFFTPDEKMAKIFGKEKMRAFSMSKFISPHILDEYKPPSPASVDKEQFIGVDSEDQTPTGSITKKVNEILAKRSNSDVNNNDVEQKDSSSSHDVNMDEGVIDNNDPEHLNQSEGVEAHLNQEPCSDENMEEDSIDNTDTINNDNGELSNVEEDKQHSTDSEDGDPNSKYWKDKFSNLGDLPLF